MSWIALSQQVTATEEIARQQFSTWHKAKAGWQRRMEWCARRLCSTRPCISHTHNIPINQSEESSKLVITREHKFPHDEQTRGKGQQRKWKWKSTVQAQAHKSEYIVLPKPIPSSSFGDWKRKMKNKMKKLKKETCRNKAKRFVFVFLVTLYWF